MDRKKLLIGLFGAAAILAPILYFSGRPQSKNTMARQGTSIEYWGFFQQTKIDDLPYVELKRREGESIWYRLEQKEEGIQGLEMVPARKPRLALVESRRPEIELSGKQEYKIRLTRMNSDSIDDLIVETAKGQRINFESIWQGNKKPPIKYHKTVK